MKGANYGIESGHEGVRRGIARDRFHHLFHETLNIYGPIRRSLQFYNLANILQRVILQRVCGQY